MKDFKDKVAVITGAASGIGLGIAKRAVKEGMKVVIADIEEKALTFAEDLLRKSGDEIVSVLTDVSKAEDMENLAQKTLDTYGEVHLLFNNAGVGLRGVLWDFSLSDWKWLIDVNLWGVIHGISIFLPIMLQQNNECHIVNTSSLSGLTIRTLNGIYAVTKHGIVALSETLSNELKKVNSKIKISVLCPGAVKTKILNSERNRPLDLRNPEHGLDIDAQISKFVNDHPEFESDARIFGQGFTIGITPEKVGNIVFEAIKDDAFYIFTDTNLYWKNLVKDRTNKILEAFKQNRLYAKKAKEDF
jgi:NADP-dependent 3-hydroxy acid dehydrogenase YdfG